MEDGKERLAQINALFVYGTLRQGFCNHFLLKGATFCGVVRTRGKYALYAEGIPYVSKAEAVSEIVGEVFQVDEETLERVDRLEGHPHWYRREETEVILADGSNVWAWMYFNESPRGRLIESGDYADRETERKRRM